MELSLFWNLLNFVCVDLLWLKFRQEGFNCVLQLGQAFNLQG